MEEMPYFSNINGIALNKVISFVYIINTDSESD